MAGKKKKQKEKIDMTFLCMTAARNKMVPHTSLPPFNNADGHLCQERLLRFRNFATMVTWCHTCPPYYLDVSKLLPCGHPATTDTPIIRTATKTQAKINYCWNLTEPPPRFYGLRLDYQPLFGKMSPSSWRIKDWTWETMEIRPIMDSH